MPDQTDWYERGCSRGCRYSHTKVWGWCDLAEEPELTLNLHMFETVTASDGRTSVVERRATIEEAEAELAKLRPVPDWADIREIARKAGWSVRRDDSDLSLRKALLWGYRDEDGILDTRRGWARIRQTRWYPDIDLHIEIVGPQPTRKRRQTVSLVDPSPAEMLAAARLIGLDQDGGKANG